MIVNIDLKIESRSTRLEEFIMTQLSLRVLERPFFNRDGDSLRVRIFQTFWNILDLNKLDYIKPEIVVWMSMGYEYVHRGPFIISVFLFHESHLIRSEFIYQIECIMLLLKMLNKILYKCSTYILLSSIWISKRNGTKTLTPKPRKAVLEGELMRIILKLTWIFGIL